MRGHTRQLFNCALLISSLPVWNQCRDARLDCFLEEAMATNKPTDNARHGAVKKRTQLKTKVLGEDTWTKRNKKTGKFMDQKKAPAKKKFKGVRREKKAA
jgi:hypothetical protein